ncbi:MAG TPA: hypothetical protein VKA16_10840 [Burkholderiales bacterium]|nr:hypothetical protein [Burkholderiales bacterium]
MPRAKNERGERDPHDRVRLEQYSLRSAKVPCYLTVTRARLVENALTKECPSDRKNSKKFPGSGDINGKGTRMCRPTTTGSPPRRPPATAEIDRRR